ncbi:hypothetical protein BGZ76_001184, partial [Entomortierella beljakovae]
AEKGKYLLEKGDAKLKKHKIGEAISHYEEAEKYCSVDAQERIERCGQYLKDLNKTTSTQSSPQEVSIPVSRQFKLVGPYFSALSATSYASTHTSASPSQESPKYSINDVPSTLALVNMFSSANEEEMKSINTIIDNIIQQYNEDSRTKEYIQELTVLATIPEERIFRTIITQLLKIEQDFPTFPELTIHGLAVILTSAPKDIDLKERQGFLSDILVRLNFRLSNIRAENNSQELLPLLRALSALFDVMLCRGMRHLSRLEVFVPINAKLSELTTDESIDHEVSFLARYAIQSLAYIRNDESLAMSIFRHGRLAIGIISDIRSAVLEFNIGVFDSVYGKIMDMSDYTIKMEWYQGLLLLDYQLASNNLSDFEKFVIESKLNLNEHFMQGVCLCVEQFASTNPNPQVCLGAQKLLKDLKSYPKRGVQLMAQMALERLGTTGPFTPGVTTGKRLAPVWSDFWYTDANSHLLKAAQEKLKRESNMLTLGSTLLAIHEMVTPKSYNMEDVNRALMGHYSSQLTIHRVTGRALELESCYINLGIVEASSQRKQDEEELKKQSEKFIRMTSFENISSTNTEDIIPIEKILEKRKLLNGKVGIPKRILIIGRAGVGKTTFCKKLVHTFQKGIWKDRFEAILWLPLRLLKQFQSRSLSNLLIEKYFTKEGRNDKEGLADEFIKASKNGKVLFVLDGLDEFATMEDTEEGDPLQSFLMTLLDQPNVIVTTRPYSNDRSLLQGVDLELETVGFSTENVEKYVKSVVADPQDSNAVLSFIQQTPLIQGLVNIPIQLDLICFSWKDLTSNKKSTTITQLYQTIVQKLWRRDAVRMKKKIEGTPATEKIINNLLPDERDICMATDVEFLGYLAFQGLKNKHQLIFDENSLTKASQELHQHRMRTNQCRLPRELLDEIKKFSVLHKPESEVKSNFDTKAEIWSFIHLTFQEYFAAKWLSKYFQSKQPSSTTKPELMDVYGTMTFIRQNKYNPRFEIVWWMISGQLSGDALSSYFQLLQGTPRDLIGVRHQLLIAGCYKEAYFQLSNNLRNQIEDELTQWLHFDTSEGYTGESNLGKKSFFPEEVLIKALGGPKDNDEKILRALRHHKYLKSSTINNLIQLTKSKGMKELSLVINALGSQSIITKPSATAIVTALQNENSDVRRVVVNVLGNHSSLSDSTTAALVSALKDEDGDVRVEAANALGKQSTLSDSTITALVTALQDEDRDVRVVAANALGKQSILSDSTTTALVTALQDDDKDVREAAVNALGKQSILSDSTETELITALQSGKSYVREAAGNALGNQSTLSDSTTIALVTALQDEKSYVRRAAVNALGKQSSLSDSTTTALVTVLQDKNWNVREAAAYALGSQSTLSDSTTIALVTILQDKTWNVREAATYALGNQSTLSDSISAALVTVLKDKTCNVREAAANALRNQSNLSDSTMKALVIALKDEDRDVRKVEANAFGNQSTFPESTAIALVTALKDVDRDVREAAANVLGSQSTLSEHTLMLIGASLCETDKGYYLYDILGTKRVLLSVKDLTVNQIEMLYRRGFYQYSCDHHVSLFIHDNQLQVYTEQGFDKSCKLSTEVLDKIRLAFIKVQKSRRIQYISYE